MNRKLIKYGKIVLTALLLSAILYLYLLNAYDNLFYQDDSFTAFRYVKNLLGGNGLTFNPGEFVEGYTNFLWVMLLAGFGFIGLDYVSLAQCLSILFGGLILVELYFISLNVLKNKRFTFKIFALIPPLLTAFNGGFIYWSVSAMETTLFIFLILAGTLSFMLRIEHKEADISTQVIFLFAALTRPEGFYYYVVIMLYDLFFSVSTKKNISPFGLKKVYELSFFFVPFAIYLLWKLYYYGDILPNTFYAKTGFGVFYLLRGLEYITNAFLSHYYFLLLPVPLVFLVKKMSYHPRLKLMYFLLAANIANVLFVGGDVLPLNRFVLISVAIAFVILTVFLSRIWERISKQKSAWAFLSLLLLSVFAIYTYDIEINRVKEWRSFELGLVQKMKEYARFLKEISEKEKRIPKVALSTIGALSFYSNAKVVDLIGLTDKYIAHNPKEEPGIAGNISVLWKERRYNADYILSMKPDYIIFPAGLKPSAYPEAAIFSKSEFYYYYYPQLIYSDKMNSMLPVYTLKKLSENITPIKENCSVDFVEYYIRASNYLLKMSSAADKEKLERVSYFAQAALQACPERADLPSALLGIANYHAGYEDRAEKFFLNAYRFNKFNSVALYYLMKINFDRGITAEGTKYLRELKKLSPFALPSVEK